MNYTNVDKFNKFKNSYDGIKLLRTHSLDTVGIWQVYGEGNSDSTSYQIQPLLGTFEGRLRDVIDYAVQLDKFFTWGGGGKIELITIQKITEANIQRRRELLNKLNDLKTQATQIENELNCVEGELKNY